MFEKIKAIAMDVDGVLTDNTFWWGANGEELKRFCFADVTGLSLARNKGIKLALISGESSPSAKVLVQRFADKLKIPHVYAGCHDKAAAVREFAELNSLDVSEVCFVGDDFLDVAPMQIVGVGVAPANAQTVAKAAATWVATRDGGMGIVREVIERILEDQPHLA